MFEIFRKIIQKYFDYKLIIESIKYVYVISQYFLIKSSTNIK